MCLQLLFASGGSACQLLQDRHALTDPLEEFWLCLSVSHSFETFELGRDLGLVLSLPFLNESSLFFATTLTGFGGAQRSLSHLLNVRAHVLFITELVTHGLGGLLWVRFALISGLLVEVTDCGPTPGAGAEVAPNGGRGKVDIAKGNIGV